MGRITLPSEIITSDKTPRTAIAFDRTSGAKQLPDTARHVLLVGQMTSDATVAASIPTVITREDDGANFFGEGSIIDIGVRAAFVANPFVKLSVVGITNAGVAATATVVFADTAELSTIYRLRIAGKEYPVDVTLGDTITTIGDNLEAAIMADPQCPVTANNVAGTVTLTAKNGGTVGNGIALYSSFDADVELLVTTATLSGTALSGGTGAVDPTVALAAAAGERYHVIGLLLDDETSAGIVRDHTDEEGDAEHNHGEIFVMAQNAVLATQTDLAIATNADRGVLGSIYGTESWTVQIAAAMAAAMSRNEVATRPYNGMVLEGILPPPVEQRWLRTETRSLIDNGCTPLVVLPGERVAIMRAVVMGVVNDNGDYDYSTLDVTKIQGFDRFRDAIRLMFETNYAQARWAESDPDGLLPSDVATPEKVLIDLIDVARDMEAEGTVSNVEDLKDQFVVEKHGTQCWFSVPALIVDGMHEKFGKIVNILRLPIA
jgi:phage tail sheath gpL-like